MTGGSGVLVLDKIAGVTSFDVVAAVRRQLEIRRVGHAGTLDPDAVGVLPILIGEATKLTPYLVDQDKEYVVTARLGVTTDTLDLSGRVLSTSTPDVERSRLEDACRRFVGRIEQVPPMYSALHHEGRRLYELARQGIEVERRSREVVVYALTVEALDGERATLRVVCGKGMYVRVLVADLGIALGCGAAVERLVRSRVGPFTREAALTWPELASSRADALWSRVLPPESALPGWSALTLDSAAAGSFAHGQAVEAAGMGDDRGSGQDKLVRVHDPEGRLLGIGQITAGGGRVRPVRLLHADRPGTRVLPV